MHAGLPGQPLRTSSPHPPGIASLTFDDKYVKQRRKQLREKPQTLADGLQSGAQAFGRGVVGGLKGIVTKPIEGAQVPALSLRVEPGG